MTSPAVGMLGVPAHLVIDRISANRYYRVAVETDDLEEAIELRGRAIRMRAELPPVPAVPLPATPDADLDAWLDDAAATVQIEYTRAARDNALARLIDTQEMRISRVTTTPDPSLARLDDVMQTIMNIARRLVERLDGCHDAPQIVANGDPKTLAAYQDLRSLREDEYDAVRTAQDWIIATDHRTTAYRSKYLDDDLASDFSIANLDDLFPQWREPKREYSITVRSDPSDPRPWPKDPVDQLIWLVASGAKVWVPTWAQLAELQRQRVAERAHRGGQSRRPNQNRRTKPTQIRTSELINREIPG
jgi:hypothetical protein